MNSGRQDGYPIELVMKGIKTRSNRHAQVVQSDLDYYGAGEWGEGLARIS